MKTEIFTDNYLDAAAVLEKGGLVAVPTETVYGLAGNGLDSEIIEKIYEVKGRPAYKPISLMVSDISDISRYTRNAPEEAYDLASRFWPGPLTIILPAADFLPSNLLAGGTTVGLRCPASPKTLDLLNSLSFPLAVPSANISGQPSPKTAQDVIDGLGGKIEGLIDGGPCELGFESTIIDMSCIPFRILRHGSLPDEDVYSALTGNMEIIGLAGCSGAGKTTALHVLEDLGFVIIDCDKLYHSLLENNQEMLDELQKSFPGSVGEQGLDRKKLAGIVFSDPSKLQLLNRITHKHVVNSVSGIITEAALNGKMRLAIDAVELFSSGLNELCSFTVAVLAERDIRIKRLTARDSITEAESIARIDAQKSDDYYISLADYSVYNNSSENMLRDSFINIISKEKKK